MMTLRYYAWCLFLVLCCHAASAYTTNSDTVEYLMEKVSALELQTTELTKRLNDRSDGEILWFRDRKGCPEGYLPMENAEGRVVIIGSGNRGRISGHTILDKPTLSLPCASVIGVAESGMMQVCNLIAGNITHVNINIEEIIPHIYVGGCFRPGASSPVVP